MDVIPGVALKETFGFGGREAIFLELFDEKI
jgi:hypothetical protein